ncbi:MAG: SDR family oxidoreductase [Thiohalomonadales bacterium]
MKNVLITGCGDIGIRVAKLWLNEGAIVSGICRSNTNIAALKSNNINALIGNFDKNDVPEISQDVDIIYYFVPPPMTGSNDPRIDVFLQALAIQKIKPERFILISTSGVYGDHQGASVDESTPTNPKARRAKRRLDAETQLISWSKTRKVPTNILRVAGIYGPGRLPEQRIRNQVPVLHEYLAPRTNRIHSDDLATICFKVAINGKKNRIYNVSDGQTGNMTEYFFTIADALGLPRPPEINWIEAEKTITPGMMSYLKESRSMDISRLQKEINFEFQYPTLKSGLDAILNTNLMKED